MSLGKQQSLLPAKKSPSESGVDLPRLSIIELMVLTAAIAITFAFLETYFADTRSDVIWFDTIQRINYTLINGLPIAAVYRFILQERKCGKSFVHPGHWVLFGLLISVVGFMLPYAIRQNTGSEEAIGGFSGNWHYFVISICNFVTAVVLFRGAMLWGWAWKAMLVLLAASFLVDGIQMIAFVFQFSFWIDFSGGGTLWMPMVFGWIDTAMNTLLTIALIPVLWTEFRIAKRWELWHWIGIVSLFLLNFVTPVLNYFSMHVFAP